MTALTADPVNTRCEDHRRRITRQQYIRRRHGVAVRKSGSFVPPVRDAQFRTKATLDQ